MWSCKMFKWIYNLFRKEKFETIGTVTFFYHDAYEPHDIILRMTGIFFLGDKGTRKVTLDYDKKLAEFHYIQPENHPFYHITVVPFKNKSGDYKTDEDCRSLFKQVEEAQKLPHETKQKALNKFDAASKDNIIKVDFDKTK